MGDRPPVSLEPISYVATAYAEPSGLPPQASTNPEAPGPSGGATTSSDAFLGLERSNTILTHR